MIDITSSTMAGHTICLKNKHKRLFLLIRLGHCVGLRYISGDEAKCYVLKDEKRILEPWKDHEVVTQDELDSKVQAGMRWVAFV